MFFGVCLWESTIMSSDASLLADHARLIKPAACLDPQKPGA